MNGLGALILIFLIGFCLRQLILLLSSRSPRTMQEYRRACRACREANPGHASFCRQCGARL